MPKQSIDINLEKLQQIINSEEESPDGKVAAERGLIPFLNHCSVLYGQATGQLISGQLILLRVKSGLVATHMGVSRGGNTISPERAARMLAMRNEEEKAGLDLFEMMDKINRHATDRGFRLVFNKWERHGAVRVDKDNQVGPALPEKYLHSYLQGLAHGCGLKVYLNKIKTNPD